MLYDICIEPSHKTKHVLNAKLHAFEIWGCQRLWGCHCNKCGTEFQSILYMPKLKTYTHC